MLIGSKLPPEHINKTFFNSGRAAFAYLVDQVIKPRKVYLPSFTCWSLVSTMERKFPNLEVEFYPDETSNTSYPSYSERANPFLFQYPKPKKISTIYDLLKGNFIQTCSVMFRSGIENELPEWFNQSPLGDWPLYILNSLNGNIYYIDEIMATYRIHDQSNWSSKSYSYRLQNTLKTAEFIKCSLDSKYQNHINKTISKLNKTISNQLKNE